MTNEDRDQILIRLLDSHTHIIEDMHDRMGKLEDVQPQILNTLQEVNTKLDAHLKDEEHNANMPVAAKVSSFMGQVWKDNLMKVIIILGMLWLFNIDITKMGLDKIVT